MNVATPIAAGLLGFALATAPAYSAESADTAQLGTTLDPVFQDFMRENHIPGLVFGVVSGGKLVYTRAFGVQDTQTKTPVDADSVFRIASMSKQFAALATLKLRDAGKLQLDARAERYIPELANFRYPTSDSPKIRVRDLLSHGAGLVTDDPWGDRQTPLPEHEFSRLLKEGVPFTRPPGMAMEYSNLGFALLGRIVTNVSGQPYADTITKLLLQPLGMQSSGFVVDAAPAERRALGYRWEDDAWRLEPTMAHGAFGAMGGIQTSANDYAKWVSYLLSAWPPRDDTDARPVKRATVRELSQGSNFPRLRARPGHSGATACRQAATYGMGMWVAVDCDLGFTLSHSGGYPGYGSHVMLMPDRGLAVFALANRTYAGPSGAVWDAALALHEAGFRKSREPAVSEDLANAYRAVGAIYQRGDVAAAGDALAMNFLMDKDAGLWSRNLADLKKKVGECDTSAAVKPAGAR